MQNLTNERSNLNKDKERRRHERSIYEALIFHDASTNDITHTGKMFNFCKGGLYFESDQIIYPGEDIFVGLAARADSIAQNGQLIFEVKIIWHKELRDSRYRYGFGGQFLNSNESFDLFPESGQAKNPAEHENLQIDFSAENDSRKHSRRPYNKLLHFTYNDNRYKQAAANIGRGGAFILTKEKFALGGKLTLTVPRSRSPKKIKVTCWIVRISPDGIGVSFERRAGRERRNDLDRRTGLERRNRKRGRIKQ